MNKIVSLAVMRLQPLHNGHKFMIDTMIDESDLVIVGIGSINKQDEKNPYSFDVRSQMIQSIYGQKVKIVPLNDIGAANKKAWADYVLEQVKANGLADPTIYYAGTEEDASWFEERLKVKVIGRESIKISATEIRADLMSGKKPSFVPAEVLEVIGV